MTAHWAAIAVPILLVLAAGFVASRLRFFEDSATAGRYPFLSGTALLTLAAIWHAIATTPGYDRWFVINAYRTLDLLEFCVFLAGLALVALGLHRYAESQLARQDELKTLEGKLTIQENLQQEARGHFQLLELLNVTLKELLIHFPGSAGAAFLVNRGKGQLILGAGLGLTKNETAGLEKYPLGRNLITHAIEDGAPVIAGAFEFAGEHGRAAESRFGSSLVLPLISGGEKIGAIVLLAEPPRAFGRIDVRYLIPVAQWLAERILAARLGRELSVAKSQLEAGAQDTDTILSRLHQALQELASPEADVLVCRGMVGLYGAASVHVCSLQSGRLQIVGGGPREELSEALRTALIDAVDRHKPMIINQETTDQGGRTIVVRSNLIVPLPSGPVPQSLLLRKEGAPFEVGERELRILDLLGQIVFAAMRQSEIVRRDLSRRAGFDKVIALLSGPFDNRTSEAALDYFLAQIQEVIPPSGIVVAFQRHEDASYTTSGVIGADPSILRETVIAAGEGLLSTVGATREPYFAVGKKSVLEAFETFHPENRHLLHRLFDENQLPSFAAFCPIGRSETVIGIAAILLPSVTPEEAAEWERLLTLAGGLYSLRLTVDAVRSAQSGTSADFSAPGVSGLVNDINNHLSAVIGTAGLALNQEQLSGDMKAELTSIIAEAERAANVLKRVADVGVEQPQHPVTPIDGSGDINASVDGVLQTARISGDLYMAGGRAREIVRRFGRVNQTALGTSVFRQFFESVIDRFASAIPDDDIMTISTYEREGYVYLDISRHRRNFPPVDHVSTFGDYEIAERALHARPADIFLTHLASEPCFYAYDRIGSTPAYLSFKFPVQTGGHQVADSHFGRTMKILAIDDQPVILDLVSAMCQSMGYRVETARSGEEGLRLAAADRFDLVLTDLAMPDMSGMEVARRIHRQYPDTTIVLITGWETGVDSGQMQEAGVSQVLYKPFRIEQLADVVKSTSARLAL
ncbi:hypothetical protein C3F09_11830 [candidate division GN15 bacterium]|uniref:Response regulatory domain-containing protein n=1 Tax=candidate division GN15 bacterium TaxID=2072418 RepID=A0A855WWA6_9BACT|nr:MAG: hypothetical protein C3F09_11830 [candidate division GN15 bacterium]